jgi:hypothetical protein
MTDWGKRVFLGSLVGAVAGVLLGLVLARLLWPAPEPAPVMQPTATVTLTPVASRVEATAMPTTTADGLVADQAGVDREVVVVSALYALDGDLERARQRLLALGLDDPAGAVAELALSHAAVGNEGLATDLATLAAALGQQPPELLAYVATATFTATPPPTETPLPTATPTAPPSETPSPVPSPTPTAPPPPTPTRRPAATRPPPTATLPPPAANPLPLEWDRRVDLLSPPVKLVPADVAPGQAYWRLVRLEWWKAGEGGNTLLYVSTLDEQGNPLWGQKVIVEHGPQEVLYTQPGGAYGANYPMASTLNSYHVFIGGDLPSERVTGLGLGEWYGGLDHTTFVLVFQRSTR